jgi:hypothetical protein
MSAPHGKLLISFAKENVQLADRTWLFKRRNKMRFEWLALLAFKRATAPSDQAWVTVKEIARLPHWRGRSKHHIVTNVGRYLDSPELDNPSIVAAEGRWAGPYRLNVAAPWLNFDVPLQEVRKRLRLRPQPAPAEARARLLKFTYSYVRAQWLFFRGRLVPPSVGAGRDNAYDRFVGLTADKTYVATLRLLACLSAAGVLYRRGRVGLARRLLLQNAGLVRGVTDLSLKAQFHLKLAWAYQRASSGPQSNSAVKIALNRASAYAENCGDRASLALLAYRWAWFLSKNRHHQEAVDQMLLALEGYLITENYDGVQATCANIGSIIHRLGAKHYDEAREWLLLSITIARWMQIGRDDAHAEMILGKIYAETERKALSRRWLERAERIATRAGGRINLADTKMVWGFFFQRFGTRDELIDTLAGALRIFRDLKDFDIAQKERYMEKWFSEVWAEVIESAESD